MTTFASKTSFSFNLKSDQDGRVDLGALHGVKTICALGYLFPVATRHISSKIDRIVVPHTADGTVFIPANMIPPDSFPQLEGTMNRVVHSSERQLVISSLPHGIRSCERNGVIINTPPPGLYSVHLLCYEGLSKVSLQVVAPAASGSCLSVNQGITCEIVEPSVPIDCRIKSIKCQDSNLVVAAQGSASAFEKMNITVWFCRSFPLGVKFSGTISMS